MAKEDFSVKLISREDGSERPLNVIDVSADDGTVDVMYGGAYSGTYDLEVSHSDEGSFLTSGVSFEAKIQVESFSPTSGSKFGGTLVTITGGHFSDNIQDNPVQIDYSTVGGVDHYCYVQESSDSEIKCRMATDYNRGSGDAEVIVFASTYEEATYADGVDNMFTFLDEDSLPTIGDYTKEFTSDLKYQITITGSGMDSETTDSVDVFIGGV